MPIASTIPDKILPKFLRDLKKGKYDNTILFALAAHGPHKLKEFVNDANSGINNRLEKEKFLKWASRLKTSKFIHEYNLDNEVYYRITHRGEDELLNRIERNSVLKNLLNRLIVSADEGLGGSVIEMKNKPISTTVYSLSYKDFVFGLLSVNWRLDVFSKSGEGVNELHPEKKMSFG
ncbi:MAG: hypothetical protein ACXAC5_24300, partial [Promethearchaeota archaeon]